MIGKKFGPSWPWHLTLGYGLPQLAELEPLEPAAIEAAGSAAQEMVREVFGCLPPGAMPLPPAKNKQQMHK